MLKRHLMTAYGMTPEEYRAKWGLKPDYPMVAPSYARKRQELAMKIGLGASRGHRACAAAEGQAVADKGGSGLTRWLGQAGPRDSHEQPFWRGGRQA